MNSGAPFPAFFREILALPPEGSSLAAEVDWLHLLVITTTMLGSVGVAVVAFIFVVRYRQRRPGQLTRYVVESARFELTVAAGLLTLFVGFFVLGFYVYLDIMEPPEDDDELVVYVMAKQWMWKFSYPDGRATNGILVVPERRQVKLVMTSRDVIHSFFVPAFRIKQDILPGRYTVLWFKAKEPATYQVLCAEYCGLDHSLMRAEVQVLREDEFGRWLETNTPAGSEAKGNLATYGREVATKNGCLACHTVDGQPHIGPTWSRLYGSWVELQGGERVKADDAYLTESMMEPNAQIVRGYGPMMPSYQGRLSHTDVAALVEYIRSLKDGPVVPTVDIAGAGGGAPPPDLVDTTAAGPHEGEAATRAAGIGEFGVTEDAGVREEPALVLFDAGAADDAGDAGDAGPRPEGQP